MERQQRRREHRHDVCDLRIHLRDVADEQEEARHEEAEAEDDAEPSAHDEADEHDHPCHEEHRFVAVAHGNGARNNPTQSQTDGQGKEREGENDE